MIRIEDNIKDDELRVLGTGPQDPRGGKGPRWHLILAAVCALIAAGAAIYMFGFAEGERDGAEATEAEIQQAEEHATDYFETVLADSMEFDMPIAPADTSEAIEALGEYSITDIAYTETIRKEINDIALDIYIPHNAHPQLFIGTPDPNDKNIILTTQAADIRADNGKINGAYVLAGEPKAWGLSKRGYCGIIDGKISVGVAKDSPLFEQATETGGFFFRQYPLVDNGTLVDNEPKGKSIRKALCERGEEHFVVMTVSKESFHDFAQALVDLGCSNAIYLVGGDSCGFCRTLGGELNIIYPKLKKGYEFENHIQWVTD